MGDYSWHTCIEFSSTETQEEVLGYYKQIGMSLALFYCLNGTDFHYENIIHSKGKPWFIDLECVFTISIHPEFVFDSVLNTLIIPTLQGAALDLLICGIGTKNTMVNKISPKMNEEGKVYLKIYPFKLGGGYNTPAYNNNELNDKIIDAIVYGYEKMVSLLRERKSIQRSLAKVSKLKGRILFRATKIHGDILTISKHPAWSSVPLLRNIYIACALYLTDIPIDVIRSEYLSLIDGKTSVFYVDLLNEKCHSIDGAKINVAEGFLQRKEFLAKNYRATSQDETVLQKTLIAISLKTLFPQTNAAP